MSDRPKLLVVGVADLEGEVDPSFYEACDLLVSPTFREGLEHLQGQRINGICFSGGLDALPSMLLEGGGILERVPDGYALVDLDQRVLWSNAAFATMCPARTGEVSGGDESGRDVTTDGVAASGNGVPGVTGSSFYDLFGPCQVVGPDYCPLNTALGAGATARSTLRVKDGQFFEIRATPIGESEGLLAGASDLSEMPSYLLVSARDVTDEVAQRQKLAAIHQAGLDLTDLAPEEVLAMSIDERIELLKSKIGHYISDLLQFETVEIRLLDASTKDLRPLLAVGMTEEAERRVLAAGAEGQGVTGFVAASGKSYLCNDARQDRLYLPGADGALSSLTVPLVLHEDVLGTLNVESSEAGAFHDTDLQFLELFAREVAASLNTLELLAVEKTATASQSVEKMLTGIAPPLDEILCDAAWILERYIGHDEPVAERLGRILKHARDIRGRIRSAGHEEGSVRKVNGLPPAVARDAEALRDKRVLVVDEDEAVRLAAHEILGRAGCSVETAHDGEEAGLMVRSFHYDAALIDIRLPDMSGSECFRLLRRTHEHLPLILMTGYGYDPTHSIVKAREMGLKAVLFKPFRLDQLIGEVGKAVSAPDVAVAV